jgi:hypothetical protein
MLQSLASPKEETMQSRSTRVPIEDVLRYSNPRVIERHLQDAGISRQDAERRFEGLKQFMLVATIMPGRKVTSPDIDAMWHTFLLFTKDYRGFCADYLGMFIEHEPFESAAPWAYDRTRESAAALFGSLDERLWPVMAKADCSSGCEG